jgi:hypothetical protein
MAGGFITLPQAIMSVVGGVPVQPAGAKTIIENLRAAKSMIPGDMGGILAKVLQQGPGALLQNPIGAVLGQMQGQLGGIVGQIQGLASGNLSGLLSAVTGASGLQSALGNLSQVSSALSGLTQPPGCLRSDGRHRAREHRLRCWARTCRQAWASRKPWARS